MPSKSRALVIALGVLLMPSWTVSFAADEDAGFVPLFNGQNLDGWEVKDGEAAAWSAADGMISCSGENGGWLRSSKMYSDFILRIEYRIPAGGNSGVGLRFPLEGNPAHDGMEIQILDDAADEYKNLEQAQYTGGIYYQVAAKHGVAKPIGEWNAYELRCVGPQVTVILNGEVVAEANVDEQTTAKGEYKPLAERPRVGFVGMQSHDSKVDFRNIMMKELTVTTESGLQYIDLAEGTGDPVQPGATVTVHYTGRLADGTKFDSSYDRGKPERFPLSKVITGWQEGIPGMKAGGRRKLIIPPSLAYGEAGAGNVIPPNATLVFDVEVQAIE